MRHLLDTIGGLRELFRLGLRVRFRRDHPYLKWRFETAFGTDPSKMPDRAARRRAVLDFGRWAYRTRRGR